MKYAAPQAQEGTTKPTQLSFFNRQTGTNAVVQTKLTVGSANDAHEHEANRTADMVMRKPLQQIDGVTRSHPVNSTPTITPVVQRACAHCEQEKEQTAQRKETSATAGGFTAPPSVSQAISRSGSGLDSNAKTFMESRFNRSFDNVQVHTDSESAASARDISARAYTSGNHIVFGDGQYQPNTEGGRHLLAHELTHVVQQGDGVAAKMIQRDGDKDKKEPEKKTEIVVTVPIVPKGGATEVETTKTAEEEVTAKLTKTAEEKHSADGTVTDTGGMTYSANKIVSLMGGFGGQRDVATGASTPLLSGGLKFEGSPKKWLNLEGNVSSQYLFGQRPTFDADAKATLFPKARFSPLVSGSANYTSPQQYGAGGQVGVQVKLPLDLLLRAGVGLSRSSDNGTQVTGSAGLVLPF
jgi:Domain of unknown function (DUF4157)